MSSSAGHPRLEFSQVAITGVAARLPGANNEDQFWQLLDEGRCAIGPLPEGRWRPERYYHPRASEPGFSYTFAGGYLDNPLDFDPSVFGISPREAAEMDPQQRLLLEVVWGALDDSGIPPSALAGANVGVYVGASSLDYGNLHTTDPASIESHFMTGNTLSVLSNRISYIYDLRGPSFTVDTACSSSLVAFAEAHAAVSAGRIDMAIVAGVNALLSPTSFIGFARASMLSPTGLCRPFSALGDGYVRAEGAVAMVLSRLSTATARRYPVRAVAIASGINSDGKTAGISLPSMEGQRSLLEQLYGPPGGEGAIDPNRLAFVEAHGTGTRVGDPAEATAIGEALGRARRAPLPIGSVKSNIGHLEPASGLAGMYKAILALEHRRLPRSLHGEAVNPAIDFADLNLSLATQSVMLPSAGTWLAGISSFGFGGTNAHVVIRQADAADIPAATPPAAGAPLIVLSAHTRPALGATADAYAAAISAGRDGGQLATAVAWQRDLSVHRLALPVRDSATLVEALRQFADTGNAPGGITGVAPSTPPKVCFVFSGNGCQWAGMARLADARNRVFHRHFTAIDAIFAPLAGWSLLDALHDPALAERLKLTRVAQPLLFAVQSALSASLAAWGIKPDMVLGHSVGEVAAAEASGAISLAEAVHVIFHRSEHQESVHGLGTMAVASMKPADAGPLIAQSGYDGLEIAAINSPTSVTISGSETAVRGFSQFARKRRIAVRVLDLAYPFHSALLEPLRLPLLDSLGTLTARPTTVSFISTVTGALLDGRDLNADYWWRNVRAPVRFRDAVEAAAQCGAGLFVEIGPRPILTANITDTLRENGSLATSMPSLIEKEDPRDPGDPVAIVAARAIVLGCKPDTEPLFGPRPGGRIALPPYAWQPKPFRQPSTSEALDVYGTAPRHPLIGARLASGTPEWRNLIDATVVPYLADHRIDGEIVVPGSGFAEMALAVAREIFPEGPIGLEDFDLLQWLPLRPDSMRELSIRLSGDTHVVEIWSRPRLGADEWTLCARGRITRVASPPPAFVPRQSLPHRMTADQVYQSALAAGVDYGPSFRRVLSAERTDTLIEVVLSPFEEAAGLASRKQILHPIALDAAFHAMFENIKPRIDERYAYLPVRFAALRVDQDSAVPARARVVVDRETDQSISISVSLYDADDGFIAGLSGGLFRAVTLDRRKPASVYFHQQTHRLSRDRDDQTAAAVATASIAGLTACDRPESWLVLEAFARSLAFDRLRSIFGDQALAPAQIADTVSRRGQAQALSLFEHLRAAGLAVETPAGLRLADESGLPGPREILETFAAEYSGASAEIVLAAQALGGLDAALTGDRPAEIRPAIIEQFESESILLAPLLAATATIAAALQARIAPDPLRVLIAEPSCLGLLRCLSPLVLQGRLTVTVIGLDAKRLHHTAARRGSTDGIRFQEIDADRDDPSEIPYDLALAMAFGPVFDGDAALGRAMARRLAPDGLMCTLQPPDNAIFDVLLGATEPWYAGSLDPLFPTGRVAAGQDSARILMSAGFNAIEACSVGPGVGDLLLAVPDARAPIRAAHLAPVVLINPTAALDPLTTALRIAGHRVQNLDTGRSPDHAASVPMVTANGAVDFVFPAYGAGDGGLDRSIAELASLLPAIQDRSCRLWILVRGLTATATTVIDPLAEAIWCFARVAINEYPSVDVKLVNLADDSVATLGHLADLFGAPAAHCEFLIDGLGVSTVSTRSGLGEVRADARVPAVHLELRTKGVLAHVDWVESTRRSPGPGEVEVAIAAAGLNFRDIMLATGLLDDDVLDDGLAGAVFGFECAGRVVAVGSAVTDLRVGDAVMGFGRRSFASHTTADARVFTALPPELPIEAAATVPVAFLTAWYALIHLAQIQPGEWVLIHGAAGGVGLAAMQIARLRGARIAATVSTPDKRALAELFGAEKIYNSRSIAFLDAIRADLGGVDVVLNSLAGDAMLASLKCLKPFGRFIELGKRDYVLNTALGLRPFRRNLSYFGVDLDQLLAANLPLAQRLMGELVHHLESGALAPLPYRAFDWHEAGEAFQLMQAASHVGKLIIRPAATPVATSIAAKPFHAGSGVHLVVGGTGGFGFETAAWLAEKGAKIIVVASRRGRLDAGLEARATAIRATGAALIVVALDVTDGAAVTALIERLTRTYGRLAGVMHTAMVLDDGMIASLEPGRTRAVLAPKVDGATHLDRATANADLDYFVVFSSVTTMIGNPGQSVYVAANGYLQGLMRRRRESGRPGLAVAWGAIADVGVLARDAAVASKLERISGIVAMPSGEALSYLESLLARPELSPPLVYCAGFRPGAALQSLKLLGTPGFSQLFVNPEGVDAESSIDLATQIAGKSEGEARAIVSALVASEVARILRLSVDEIEIGRPLDELGMDSLMSLELRMSIETRFGVELPIVAISSGINVSDLAARLIAGLAPDSADTGAKESRTGDLERQLIVQHAPEDLELSDLMAVTEAIEERRAVVSALL